MEHPCHRCGSPVPDSSPFCPECGAPQVRFDRSETSAANVLVSQPEAAPLAPPPVQNVAWRETNHRVAGRERAVILRSAINAGVVAAILSLFPGVIVGMPVGGFLAVLFYRRRSWRAEPSLSGGFRLGALAGIIAFAIFGIVRGADASMSSRGAELRQQMIENRQQTIERFELMESRASDPQQRQTIQQAIDYLKTRQGMIAAIIFSAVIMAVICVILSGLGGLLSASFLRRKGPRD